MIGPKTVRETLGLPESEGEPYVLCVFALEKILEITSTAHERAIDLDGSVNPGAVNKLLQSIHELAFDVLEEIEE